MREVNLGMQNKNFSVPYNILKQAKVDHTNAEEVDHEEYRLD